MAAVAAPAQRHPEDLEFDWLDGGDVQHRFDHRQLDELARPVRRRSRSAASTANAACTPASGSQAPRGATGGPSGNPVTQARPAICSMVGRESDPLAPRTIQPERRHPGDDELGVQLEQHVGGEPEVVHHARREVLDHDVGLATSVGEQRDDPRGSSKSSVTERLLVFIGVEYPAVLPPVVDVVAHAARVPNAVGPLDRLHLDDVGAERGEQVGRGRPGPERGQVDDANALERQPRRLTAGESDSRLLPGRLVVGCAERGRLAQRRRPAPDISQGVRG